MKIVIYCRLITIYSILFSQNGFSQTKEELSIRYSDSIAAVEAAEVAFANGVSCDSRKAIAVPSSALPSVCGITFGSRYWRTEKQLEERYGPKELYSNKSEIIYFDFPMGDYVFDSARFGFEYDKNGFSFFNYVGFSIHVNLTEKDLAIKIRDSLAKTLSKKYYNIISKIGSDGFKYYLCGDNPFEERYLICLSVEKSQSKGGDWYYYINLDYGPIHFIDSTDDF